MAQRKRSGDMARIKIVGVGGGGSNAVSRMSKENIQGAELICLNTDAQALERMDVPSKVRIGERLTKGLGAGGDPDLGRESAEESQDDILKAIRGADMTFIATGMGGGTGTGGAPVIARVAKSTGALTVAVVTKPFTFEGQKRRRLAEDGIRLLSEKVDTLITVSNDRLLELCDPSVSIMGAFSMVDDILCQGIQAISDVITVAGEINVDFADVRSIMADSGRALMAIGTGKGENRVGEATEAVLSSPLLDTPIEGATGVLFNISGDDDLTLLEINKAAQLIGEAVNPEAEKIFGVVTDPKLNGEMRITLIATGLGTDPMAHAFREEYRKLPVERSREAVPTASSTPDGPDKEGFSLDIPTFLRRRSSKGKEQNLRLV
ncbi:MAG: cell division protein FtsZ [Dehalococcoidia bacterium]